MNAGSTTHRADASRAGAPVDLGAPLPLPHERDQSPDAAGKAPREVIRQAQRDLDAGLVDTDLRATPGLDAVRREQLLKPARPKQRRR